MNLRIHRSLIRPAGTVLRRPVLKIFRLLPPEALTSLRGVLPHVAGLDARVLFLAEIELTPAPAVQIPYSAAAPVRITRLDGTLLSIVALGRQLVVVAVVVLRLGPRCFLLLLLRLGLGYLLGLGFGLQS